MTRRKSTSDEPLEYRLDSILRIRPLNPAAAAPPAAPPPEPGTTAPTLSPSPRRLKSRRLSNARSAANPQPAPPRRARSPRAAAPPPNLQSPGHRASPNHSGRSSSAPTLASPRSADAPRLTTQARVSRIEAKIRSCDRKTERPAAGARKARAGGAPALGQEGGSGNTAAPGGGSGGSSVANGAAGANGSGQSPASSPAKAPTPTPPPPPQKGPRPQIRNRVAKLVTRRERVPETQPAFPRVPKRLPPRDPNAPQPEQPLARTEFAPHEPFEHEPRAPPHELGSAKRFGRTVPTRTLPTQKHALRRALAEKPIYSKRRDMPKVVPSILEEDENPEVNDIPSEVSFALPAPKSVLSAADVAARKSTGKALRAELVIAASQKADTPWAMLRVPERGVPLCGFAWVSVMRGTVQVHGATLGPESPPLFLQSPVGTAIPIEPMTGKVTPPPLTRKRWTSEHHDEDAGEHVALRESLTFELEGETTVVLLSATNRTSKGASVNSDLPFSLPLWSLPPPLVRLFPMLHVTHPEVTPLQLPMCWSALKDAVRTPRNARVLVLGTRGAGKSTLARSLVNHVVSTQPGGAMFLETDISRPDRSVYGLVAAHRVHHASTTAMSACRDVPYCARLFGDLTPRDDPELFHDCQGTVGRRAVSGAAHERVPLICNTHGWMNGDGVRLMHELLQIMQPTCVVVVQLKYRTASDDGLDEVLSYLPPATTVIRTEPMPVPLRPHQHVVAERDMVIGSYLSNEMTLGRARMLESVRVAIVTEPGGRGGKLDGVGRYPLIGIVGHLVALGISPRGRWRRDDEMQSIEMVGFAVVRGINGDASRIFVATPVPALLVRLVTCLVLPGSVQTPVQVFARASAAVGWDRRRKAADGKRTLPPFSLEGSVPTAAPMRSRNTLARRGDTTPRGGGGAAASPLS